MKKQFSFFEAFDRKMSELLADSNTANSAPEPIAFTQAELQFLKSFLATELTVIEQIKLMNKEFINEHWEQAEKGTEDGAFFFKCLNQEKQQLRKEKAKQKKLVAVQQKIKGMLKTL
jgi:hypothetical protein